MNSGSNIITVVRSIVSAMTPVITITANVADGANWKLSMCKTYWITPNQYVTIGGETFKVLELSFNDYIIVSGTAQPVGPTFQLDAPDFVHGSSRKVANERKRITDLRNIFVYLPRPRVQEIGGPNSDVAYIGSIRPIFLVSFDPARDNTDYQQENFIDPMNSAADLFETIINDSTDKFEETDFFNREEWMNFGDPNSWGNDKLIFDQKVSGVELSLDLQVFDEYACICDGSPDIVCAPVRISVDGVFSEEIASGGSYNCVTGGGDDVTTDFNSTPTGVDTLAGDNIAINVVDDDDTPVGTLETNTANLKEIRIANSNVSNSDDTYSVDVLSEQNLELPDITVTDSDGSSSSVPSMTNVVCTPAPTVKNVSNPMKSGAADLGSFATNDDANTNFGRLGGFYTLDTNNPFGHLWRFTGKTGGYYDNNTGDYKDVNGTITTEALSFPDDIMLDWASEHQGVKVLAFQRTPPTQDSQAGYLASSPFSVDGYSDWYILNMKEAFSIWNFGIYRDPFNFPPLNYLMSGSITYIWTSYKDNAGAAYRVTNTGISPASAGSNAGTFIRRYYTYAELGL